MSPDGYAVHGMNYATSGYAIGLYGDTQSPTGIGVYGATASTGNGKAIYGIANSTGYAGYFLGGQVYIDTKLGIGKGAVYTLDVVGTANLLNGIPSGIALRCNGDEAIWYNGTYYSWGYGGAYNFFGDRIKIGGDGNVAPSTTYALYITGNAYATGSWSSSDMRFKKDITAISNPLERLLKVSGASYEFRRSEFKDYTFAQGRQLGFIAQDLEGVFPEVVTTESDGFKSVNYNGMIPVLLEAIKEQQKMIEGLRKENEKQNARLESLEKRKE
jgi:hypothetical protein